MQLDILYKGTLNSYSQIFFSKRSVFAVLVILASFINPVLGFYGLLGVVLSNIIASVFGFSKEEIKDGIFGVNSLLVCLAIAGPFQSSEQLLFLILIGCVFTVFLTVGLNGLFGRLGLPALSFPFLFSLWTILLATRNYGALQLSEGNIFLLNEIYNIGGMELIGWYEYLSTIELPTFIAVYLKSLGAILFEYNILSGILIAVGLFLHSRISFLVSLIGFGVGYLYYLWFEGDLDQIHYSYIGFNFILCSIAIGAFFFIPNKKSLLFIALITPIVALLIGAASSIFSILQLPIYSLPFILVVIMTLYLSNFFNYYNPFLIKVVQQTYSPEENKYNHIQFSDRYQAQYAIPLSLPFYGSWKVSQAYDGDKTHKGNWKEALDFTIENETGLTYKTDGSKLEDFYCYKLPILAPVDGTIEEIENSIEDNAVGEINMNDNWGNTVVIQFAPGLYVQLSHLLKDSIIVKKGDAVKKGDIVGYLGNSGRSPEPHLHMQVQNKPAIGSPTIPYPIGSFIHWEEGEGNFIENTIPKVNSWIENSTEHPILKNAFNWIPGNTFRIQMNQNFYEWSVATNAYNQTYIFEEQTQSICYFQLKGGIFECTHFEGNKESALFEFYLAANKVPLNGHNSKLESVVIPFHLLESSIKRWLNDFIVSFTSIKNYQYSAQIDLGEKPLETEKAFINWNIELKNQSKNNGNIVVNKNGIESITTKSNTLKFLND